MSYNLVNPTTGALTKVSGNISSNIIPSNASANNKLVTESDTFINYTPNTSDYSTWAEFLDMLYQKGTGLWCGKAYLDSQWWYYTANIQIGAQGYWLGSGIFKSADNNQLRGVNKAYSTSTTWNIVTYVTESDLPKKYIDTGSGISFDTCRIALGLPYPCRFKFEFWALDNSCFIEGYAYRESASVAPITRYVGTSGYAINSNAGGTMACYTGNDNVPGSFICTELKS